MKKIYVAMLAMALLLGACGGGEAGSEGKSADDGMIEISQINKKGQKFLMEFNRTEEITGKAPGSDKESTDHNSMTMWVEMEVTDVDAEGNATMKGVYKRTAVEFEMMGQTMSYDTESEPEDEMGQMFKESIGKTLTMVTDKKGHIKSVTGDQTLMDAMWPDPSYTRFDNLREQMELDAIYPDGKVKVGDTWKSNNAVTAMYPMKLSNTMTLKERKEGKAIVTVSSLITKNENQKPSYETGMPHRLDLSGTRDATYVIDEADGFVLSTETTYELEGNSRLEDPKSKKEMVSPVKMTIVDKFTYTKK